MCLLAYLAIAVPGKWFPSVPERASGAAQLSMPRGVAAKSGDELIVTRAAEDGNTVISVPLDKAPTSNGGHKTGSGSGHGNELMRPDDL